jgi:TetR/AcrR family transcriptional regulator, lmrAB and yxaGH operons repressor
MADGSGSMRNKTVVLSEYAASVDAQTGDTRNRMLEATGRLLQRHGYGATSWRLVVEAAGTPWGSAHHFFPDGKEQLAAEALTLSAARVTDLLTVCLSESEAVGDAVRRWFQASAGFLQASHYREGCPVATVALETAPESKTLTSACDTALQEWEMLLGSRLESTGVPRDRARDLATIAISNLEGALLVARIRRRIDPLILAGDVVGDLFDAASAE